TSIGSILLLLDPFSLTTLHSYQEIINSSNQLDRRHIGWKGRCSLMHGTSPGTKHQTVTGTLESQMMNGDQWNRVQRGTSPRSQRHHHENHYPHIQNQKTLDMHWCIGLSAERIIVLTIEESAHGMDNIENNKNHREFDLNVHYTSTVPGVLCR